MTIPKQLRPHFIRAAAMVLLALALATCATRPFESPELRATAPIGSIDLFDKAQHPKHINLTFKPGKHLQVLALSGGGAAGAFGAGVLNGWTKSGKRPQFDIVTGVSTGALMAVLAFLGPKYDGLLEEIYTKTSNDDIFVAKGPFSLFSDSLLDNAPLKLRIEQVVTADLLKEIASAHLSGRRLYVATTNLDAGELVVWDMGWIAASGHKAALRVFQKVLRASAAVPGFFKPVYMQVLADNKSRQMHVDGGVKAPVLIRTFMFDARVKRRTLHVIINGQMKLQNAKVAVKPKVLDISRRSIEELMRGLSYKTIYQGYVSARNAGARFRMITIPDSAKLSDDALKFDPKEMRMLYALGFARGKDNTGWRNEPPRLEDHERIVRRAR